MGKVDRVKNERTLQLPPTQQGDRLTLLVEAMGRINFGRAIKDFKGLIGDVSLTADVDGDEVTWVLKDWQMARIKEPSRHHRPIWDRSWICPSPLAIIAPHSA